MTEVEQMIETMRQEIFVNDPRPEGDESFRAIPKRLQSFNDIVEHFAPLTIDLTHGWAAAAVGETYWKLAGFHVTIGNTVINVKLLDQQQNPIVGKLVNWHFPNVPGQAASPPFFDKAISGKTEPKGIEFTISGDHWAWPRHLEHPDLPPDAPGNRWIEAHPGPDSIWVAAEPGWPRFSDAVHGLGMRGGTNHLAINPIFQPAVKEGVVVASRGALEQALIDAGKPHITPVDTEAALFKAAQEQGLGQRLTPEYEVSQGDQLYVAQIYQHGLVYALKGDWGNIKVIHRSDWRT